MHRAFTRRLRAGLAVGLVALASLALAACGGGDDSESESGSPSSAEVQENGYPDFSGITLNYLGFGGSNDEAMGKAWFKPFEKLTGLKIRSDQPTDYKKLKIQQQSGDVQYDLVDGDAFVMDPACGKEWEELELDNIGNVREQFTPGSKCTAPDYVYQYVIGYDPDLTTAPKDCSDFFDTSKIPGKRAAWSYYYGSIGECAATAAGADAKKPYPLDLDQVFDKIESIKGDFVTYDTDSQAADMMVNGDVAMGVFTTRMVFEANEQGANWKVAPGWATVTNGTFGVPKGAPNAEAAEALLNYILDKENNPQFSENLPIYGSVVAEETEAAKSVENQRLVSGGEAMADAAITVDWDWWAENDPKFAERWATATSG